MSEPFERHAEPGRAEYRSVFWPIVLIGVGVIILLANVGILEPANLGILWRLWPLLLIMIGLDILLGRIAPALSAVIGLGLVALVILAMLYGPAWGLRTETLPSFFGIPVVMDTGEVKTAELREPIGNATFARVMLDLSTGKSTIRAQEDGNDLIAATLKHVGEVQFTVSGDRTKNVALGVSPRVQFGWFQWPGQDLPWDIQLSPRVPLDLEIDASSGPAELDLSKLQLTALTIDASSGSMTVALPDNEERYTATIDASSGSLGIQVPGRADVDLDIDASSGSLAIDVERGAQLAAKILGSSGGIRINLPADAAVRVIVRKSGPGSITLPPGLKKVSEGSDPKTGTWETNGFAQASRRISLVLELSTGSVRIRQD